MRYVLLLSPAIEEDVAAVAEHYGEISPELAGRFADELERTLFLIESYPLAGRFLYGDVRRMVLDRYPYLLTYRVDGNQIRVQLLAHTRRDPEWVNRTTGDRLRYRPSASDDESE